MERTSPGKLTGKAAARGSVLLTINGILGMAIGLVSMVVLTRALGVSDYGVYILLLSVHHALSGVFQLGAGSAVIADISRDIGARRYDRVKRFLLEYSVIQMVLALVLAGAIVAGRSFLADRFGSDVGQGLSLIAVLMVVTAFRNVINVALSSHGEFGVLAFWNGAGSVLRLGGILFFVVTLDLAVPGALLADVVAQAVGIAAVTALMVRRLAYLRTQARFRGWLLPAVLKAHGKWSVFLSAGVHFSANWTTWVIALILNTEAVATYAVAKRLVAPAKVVLPLKTVLSPLLARQADDMIRVRYILQKSLQYRFLLSAVMALTGSLLAYPALALLFPELYPAVVPVFQILLFRLVVRAPRDVLNPLFTAMQMQRYSFYTFLIGQATFLIIGVPFIYFFGLIGAAMEAVIATLILGIMAYWLAVRMDPSLKIAPGLLLEFGRADWDFIKDVLSPGGIARHGKAP